MKLTWLGNSCVVIEGDLRVIIDPNYLKEPKGKFDYVLITHEHEDHIDVEKLKKIEYERLLAPQYTLELYKLDGIAVKPGMTFDDIKVLESWCWKAVESVSYLCYGVLHAGDSAKFPDCSPKIVLSACFPDYYNDYLSEMKRLKPELVIPIHYKQEKRANAEGLKHVLEKGGVKCKILEIGESIEF